MAEEKQSVFISCGQQTQEEKALGKEIQKLVRELTVFEPYFAEYQNSLEGVTKNIFGALNRCVGFIVLLHRRGSVSSPGKPIRASVWVEQEIAIAAFLRQALGRKIEVAAYIESEVALEGLRKQLLLNPKTFFHHQEVLDHIRLILPSWKAQDSSLGPPDLDCQITYRQTNMTNERHDYRLIVLLMNRGNHTIKNYHVDVEFPAELITDKIEKFLVPDRCTESRSFFRITQDNIYRELFPGDTIPVMPLHYFIDKDIFAWKKTVLSEVVRATIYTEGTQP